MLAADRLFIMVNPLQPGRMAGRPARCRRQDLARPSLDASFTVARQISITGWHRIFIPPLVAPFASAYCCPEPSCAVTCRIHELRRCRTPRSSCSPPLVGASCQPGFARWMAIASRLATHTVAAASSNWVFDRPSLCSNDFITGFQVKVARWFYAANIHTRLFMTARVFAG